MKFTIIIPAYNSAKFINMPLDSLERQTYDHSDFEVIIIDDGSTDNLWKVVKPYLKKNETWKIIKKKNGNWGSVINYIKKNVQVLSEYITILDSDDYFNENILKEVAKQKEDIVITAINKRVKNKNILMKVFIKRKGNIPIDNAFTPVSTPHGKFYKNNLFYKVIDLEEGIAYQDTVLYNDLASKAKSIYYINKPLANWWWDRPGNSTHVVWNNDRMNTWIKTCQYIIDLPNANNEVNSWVIMYLWELNRHYKGKSIKHVKMNVNLAKFKWLPVGTRTFAKKYFVWKTKKWIK